MVRELDRYLRTRPTTYADAPLFPTDQGRFFTMDGFPKVLDRIAERSGVKRFQGHLLRHTWATRFPGDLLELKRQGGWLRWEQVERYRHRKPLDQKSLYDASSARSSSATSRRLGRCTRPPSVRRPRAAFRA